MLKDDVQWAITRLILRGCRVLSKKWHSPSVHPNMPCTPKLPAFSWTVMSVSKQVGVHGAARSLQGGGNQAPASNSSGDSSSSGSDGATSDASSGGGSTSSKQVGDAVAA